MCPDAVSGIGNRARLVPLLILVPISLAMLFSPGSAVPSGPPNSDKLVHWLLFAALAGASAVAGMRWWVTALWLLTYAAVSEVLQGVLPIHRDGSVWDFLADAVGVAVGVAVAVGVILFRGRRRYRG